MRTLLSEVTEVGLLPKYLESQNIAHQLITLSMVDMLQI